MKKNKILYYWNSRAKNKLLKCTNDKNLENYEIKYFLSIIKKKTYVLDIGCGDGKLLRELTKKNKCKCYGVDFSNNLINKAKNKLTKIKYFCADMNKISEEFKVAKKFDYIITKRSIQNLKTWNEQKSFINKISFYCKKNTKIFFMESSFAGLNKINQLRKELGLKSIIKPWHNLYLEDTKIENTKFLNIKLLKIKELFSTYYFTSRVLNASISKKTSYNDPLNLVGWKLPQDLIKGFSQLRLYEFKVKKFF